MVLVLIQIQVGVHILPEQELSVNVLLYPLHQQTGVQMERFYRVGKTHRVVISRQLVRNEQCVQYLLLLLHKQRLKQI